MPDTGSGHPPRRQHWVCSCRAWTWAGRPKCHGCGGGPPPWACQLQASATAAGRAAPAARSASGDAPTEVLP
eukprot:3215667-Alexandrium_andersonii.AAC.1